MTRSGAWGIAWSSLEALPLEVGGRKVVAERRPDLGPDIFEYRGKSAGLLIFLRAADGMAAPEDATAEVTQQLLDALAGSLSAEVEQRRECRRRRRSADQRQPQDWQQPHSPRGTLNIRDLEGGNATARTLSYAVRRIVDARLWRALTDVQQQAAVDLAGAFHAGLGGAPASPVAERVDTSLSPKRFEPIGFERDYWEWAKAAEAKGISAPAVIDVVCLGKSRREVARSRHKRDAWVKRNLIEGLELYAMIKGWLRRAVDKGAGTKL